MFRTLYVGATLLGCLLEVLADFRPDLILAGALAAIDDDDDYPTAAAGSVLSSWLAARAAGTARLAGEFVDVRAPLTLATLRTRFGALAAGMGLADLDAAAVKLSEPRTLTQAISTWCYTAISPPVTGVCFGSRLADTVAMWAVFEYHEVWQPRDRRLRCRCHQLGDLVVTSDDHPNEQTCGGSDEDTLRIQRS